MADSQKQYQMAFIKCQYTDDYLLTFLLPTSGLSLLICLVLFPGSFLCENRFAGAMIDRFGTGPILTPCPDGEHFTMTAEIQVSPQFFGWVAGFGTGVVVSGPPEVRAEMKKTLDQLQELYR